MSGDRREGDEHSSGLLGDLESIRNLLDEGERAEGEPDDRDVPLLEDVVHGGVSVNETFLAGEGDFAETDGPSGLDEEVFKALLSDDWRDSARELLEEARAVIERHQTEWTPAHTDELNQALKVRIDRTLQRWLQDLVQSRVDELRTVLLEAVSAELRGTVESQFTPPAKQEGPDGE